MHEVKVVPIGGNARDAQDILLEALATCPDTVVLCMRKGDEIYTKSSATNSMVETIGMLETAKLAMFDEWAE